MKNWNAQVHLTSIHLLAYLLWTVSSVCFLVGFSSGFDFESIEIETVMGMCILISQTYSLRNYQKFNSIRNAAMIFAISLWAVGYLSSRLGMIPSSVYAVFVGVFVLLVIFIRSRR